MRFGNAARRRAGHTATQLILDLDILLRRHTEKGGDGVAVRVPVREAAGGHAARGVGGGGVVGVGHVGGRWVKSAGTGVGAEGGKESVVTGKEDR